MIRHETGNIDGCAGILEDISKAGKPALHGTVVKTGMLSWLFKV